MKAEDLKIVFFGTPEFAVESLRTLVDNNFNIRAVVTSPDKPAGRGHKMLQSDVKKFALERDIPVLQPMNLKSQEFISELKALDADLFIVIAFRMLPEIVWGMPPLGTFNLHASLLPRYRGAAPINRAIMNGDTKTGVTAFFLNQDIDTGDMFAFIETEILPEDNAGSLHDRLMKIGADMIVNAVKSIASGDYKKIPQPDEEATPAPKIFHEDCLIDWSKESNIVHNHIRGLSPYPAARGVLVMDDGSETECKLFVSSLAGVPLYLDPGKLNIDSGKLFVGTADGAIEILEIQPSGKRRMAAGDFLRGYKPLFFKLKDEAD